MVLSNSAKIFRPCLRIDRDLRPGGMKSLQVFSSPQKNVRAVQGYLGEVIRAPELRLPRAETKSGI